jgi:hypothetical protein
MSTGFGHIFQGSKAARGPGIQTCPHSSAPVAGKFTGIFFSSGSESPIYAQIPQLFFWSREFAGNLQGISSFQRNSFRTGLLRRELG